jgi:hypothetical protein
MMRGKNVRESQPASSESEEDDSPDKDDELVSSPKDSDHLAVPTRAKSNRKAKSAVK